MTASSRCVAAPSTFCVMMQFFRRASQVVPNGTHPPQLSCLSGLWFLTDLSKLVLKVLKHSQKWREEGAGHDIFVIGGE